MTPPFLTSDALHADGISHGFFGRQGGVSHGLYDSLNAGYGSDDNPNHVMENQGRIANTLGAKHLVTNHQIHSKDVVTITDYTDLAERLKADGLVTNRPHIALGALHADCAPIIFADLRAGIIGACHAGWRGAVNGVSEATILAMEALGAQRSAILAAIGPCISGVNYEVGDDFRRIAIEIDPHTEPHFHVPKAGKAHFSLPDYLRDRLSREGVTVDSMPPPCTYGNPQNYFSYRYNTHHNAVKGQSDYGRNLSAIMLEG